MNPEQVLIKFLAGNLSESNVQALLDITNEKILAGWELSDILDYLYWSEHWGDWVRTYADARMLEIEEKYENREKISSK
jgi:hypothetical protein